MDVNYNYFGEGDNQVVTGDVLDVESEVEFADNGDNGSDDGSDGSTTMDVVAYEFQWQVPPVDLVEAAENINQVPLAETIKRNPLSLSNLCVNKLLTIKITANRENIRPEFGFDIEDRDMETLNATIDMFANSQFHDDLENLKTCCDYTSIDGDVWWFPYHHREWIKLSKMGDILALASTDDPRAQLLAHNRYNRLPQLLHPTMPTYFGIPFNFANLSDITIALGASIIKRKKQMVTSFTEIIMSPEDEDQVLKNHMSSFMKKWLPASFVDVAEIWQQEELPSVILTPPPSPPSVYTTAHSTIIESDDE
jgi:hypothetical protein